MLTKIKRLFGIKPPPHKQAEPFLKFDREMERMLNESRAKRAAQDRIAGYMAQRQDECVERGFGFTNKQD